MLGALMLDVQGTQLTPDDQQVLQHPQVGGVILFGRNVVDAEQVQALTAAIRAVRPELLIGVDQEGGRVQRLKAGFTRLPPMRALGRVHDQDSGAALALAQTCGWLMASEVLSVGIDLSFAPVLDLDGVSTVIGDRSFHADPAVIVALAGAFLRGMHEAGMATTGKHFPGHGSVLADSHIAAPVDDRSLDALRATDLQAFLPLLPELDALMPAHVIYPQVCPQPAGFSAFWLQTFLRGELGYDGVLFSDDLSMEAACVAGDAGDRLRAALEAGCDMGLVCNNRSAALTALQEIADAPLPHQARLARMRGQRVDRAALLASPRWQAAVAAVTPLCTPLPTQLDPVANR